MLCSTHVLCCVACQQTVSPSNSRVLPVCWSCEAPHALAVPAHLVHLWLTTTQLPPVKQLHLLSCGGLRVGRADEWRVGAGGQGGGGKGEGDEFRPSRMVTSVGETQATTVSYCQKTHFAVGVIHS